MGVFDYENDDVPQYANQEGDDLNLFWMMCHALKVPETLISDVGFQFSDY